MRLRIYRYLHDVTAPDRTRVAWFDLVEIGLVAFGFLAYFVVRGAVVDRTTEALAHARWIVDTQLALGVFVEPHVNRWALESGLLIRLFNFSYFWLDFPLIIAVGLLLFWKRRQCYTLFRDALLISGAFALVLYWSFPVAPPRFLREWGFVDTLEKFSNLSYQAQSTAPFVNPFAAVPSLHVGWALLVAVGVFSATRNPLARIASVGVLLLQSVAVVATANHFIFDGVAGVVVSLAALWVALWLQRRGYPLVRRWLEARSAHLAPAAETEAEREREPVGVGR